MMKMDATPFNVSEKSLFSAFNSSILGGFYKFFVEKSSWKTNLFNLFCYTKRSFSSLPSFCYSIFLFSLFFPVLALQAQVTQTFTTPGAGTFRNPAGVTSLQVRLWGGGGGGGGSITNNAGGGGGGGGGFLINTNVPVLSGPTGPVYDFFVGGSGAGGSTLTNPQWNGTNGGATFITINSNTYTAGGGFGGFGSNNNNGVAPLTNGAGGAGGSAANNFAGGNGATRISNGGGGGSSAGPGAGAGQIGVDGTGAGVGGNGIPIGGGSGGTGASGGVGGNGTPPGGGGGGAQRSGGSGEVPGGNGGIGQLSITYTCTTYVLTTVSPARTCTGSSTVVTVTGLYLPAGLYTVSYDLTGANTTGTTQTAPLTVTIDGTGTFTIPGSQLPNAGSSTVTITRLHSGDAGSGCQTILSAAPNTQGTLLTGNGTISLNSGTATQTFCEFLPLSNIVYAIGGTATGATAAGLPLGLTTNFNNGLFTISGTPVQSGTFNFTVTTTGAPAPCTNLSLGGTITVNSAPQGFLTGSAFICVSGVPNLIWNATAGVGPFTVEYSDGTNTFIRNNVISGTAFPHVNTITANTTFTIVKVTTSQNCERTTLFTNASHLVPVNQLPNYTTTSANQICSGATFNFTAVPTPAGTTLAWSRPVVAGISNPAASGTGLIITENLNSSNLTNSVPVTYTLTFNNNGCIQVFSYVVTVFPQPVAPTLNTKLPNTTTVCAGQTVSATFNAGQSGLGCTDDYVVIIDNGVAVPYTPGTLVGGAATSSIVIQGRRANNCLSGCETPVTGTNYVTLANWAVVPSPTAPSLQLRNPNIPEVCVGKNVSAQFNSGTGGFGCSDNFIWKINGVVQATPYVPGTNISSAVAGVISIEGRRANCTAGTCTETGYVQLASWTVVPNPVAPTLNLKFPNLNNICNNNPISITTNPGSGGVGCSDEYILERDGTLVGAYTPGATFTPTFQNGTYVIKARRANCNGEAGCTGTGYVTLATWLVSNQPLQPQVINATKVPQTNIICVGTNVKVDFTAQGGSTACGNILQYSLDNRATWLTYANGAPLINTSTASGAVIIRAARGGCESTGCNTTPFTEVVWTVVPQPAAPTLAVRTPIATSICFGNTVSATFNAGSGGVNCTDQYRAIIDGSTIVAYTPGASIGGTATTTIVIQTRRAGCEALAGCTETVWTPVASWTVNANPAISVHPSLTAQNVCVGAAVPALSVTASAGSGSPTPSYQWYSNSIASNTGGTLIPGAIAATYPPPNNTPGTTYYYVVVTNSNGCTVTSNVSGAITVRNCFGVNVTGALINIDCEVQPVWYNGKATVSGSNSLNGGSLGFYTVNSPLLSLRGGEIRTFKEPGADVCGAKLFYRIYANGGTPGSFSELDLNAPVENCSGGNFPTGGTCSGLDQKWNRLNYNIELAVRPVGNYVIEFYFAAVGKHLSSGSCTELVVDDNNGNYYQKTFSIINDPAYTQGVGEFATSAYLRTNCSSNSFYNTTGFCSNLIGVQPLNGNNLGSYVQGSTNLLLQGGELKSFMGNDRWICGVNMLYRVYAQGSPSGTFQTISLPKVSDCVSGSFPVGGGACSGLDKKWQADAAGRDLLAGLVPGTYVLEVYYEILANTSSNAQTCNTTIPVDNGGSYYSGTFTVVPLTLTYANTPFCTSDATLKPPALTAATGFTGGTYTASPGGLTINSTTGNITPSTSTPATYTVTYTSPAVNGCVYTTTTPVTITPQPTPLISYAGSPFCKTLTSGTVSRTGTNSVGGTYSASGAGLSIDASTGVINPSASTAGFYIVTYTIPARDGCGERSDTAHVTITALPTATITYPAICSNQSNVPVSLSGTGAFSGGTFSPTITSPTLGANLNTVNGSITANTTLSGAVSTTYKVFYTIPASGGCPAVVVETNPDVVITRRPDVQGTTAYNGTPFCSNQGVADISIFGQNIGYSTTGVFSAAPGLVINATTGQVNIASSTPGTYSVSYTMPATGGCIQSISSFPNIITITLLPSASLSYPLDFYCSNTPGSFAPVISDGKGAFGGGTYSSNPNSGLTMTGAGVITPSTSTAQPYTITYTIPALSGCPAVPVSKLITITPAPTASFTYGGPFCSNDATTKPVLNLNGTGNYLGGTFSAPTGLIINAVTGAITPLGSTPGTYTVTYRTPAASGCLELPFTTSVTITPLPVINEFFYGGTPFCSNSAVGLPSLLPLNLVGSFSSTTDLQIVSSTGAIDPTTSKAGNYDVTFTIPASGNCPAVSRITPVTITPLPNALISYDPSVICPNSLNTPVTLVGSTGGVYSANSPNLTVTSTGAINASLSQIGDYTVFYTFAAAAGCPQRVFQTNVTVRDVTAPVISTPPTINVACNLGTATSVTGQATATDNCTSSPLLSFTDVITPGSCANRFTVTRTWRAEDAYGNISTSVQIINVEDNTPPIINCPANITVADPNAIPLPNISQVMAFDACGPVIIDLFSETYAGLDGKPGFCPTKVFRTYRATDACGNVAYCTQEITVTGDGGCAICQSSVPFIEVDLSASPNESAEYLNKERIGRCCNLPGSPPPTCIAFNVILHPDAIGVRLVISNPAPQGQEWRTDCQPVSLTNGVICMPGGFFRTFIRCQPGAAINDYRFEAITGAVVSDDFTTRVDCSKTISVAGVAAGTITYTDITPGGSFGTLTPALDGLTATFTPTVNSPTTVKYRVCGTLAAGGTCGSAGAVDCDTITITVVAPITPTVTVPSNVCVNNLQPLTVTNITPSNATYSYEWLNVSNTVVGTGASYTPNSPGDYRLRVTETQLGIDCEVVTFGPYNVTFDVTPPTVTAPAATLQLQCNPGADNSVALANWIATASASDNVALAPSPNGLTNNYAPVTQSCGLIQPVTFTATDHCGLTATAIANIQYIDLVPPTITCPTNLSFECASQVPVANTAAFVGAGGTYNDICDPNVSLVWVSDVESPNPKICPNVFTIARTYRAVDACNNAASCVQTITVNTVSNPVVPADVSVNVACFADAIPPTPAEIPIVPDACGTPLTPTLTVTPTIPCNGGSYIYSYTYTDCSGLNATWRKIYSIPADVTLPTITAPATIDICRLPSGTYTIPAVTASDNCASPVTNSYTITGATNRSGTGLDASGVFALGISTITWQSVDICGNTRIETTTVNIFDIPTAAISGSIISCPGTAVTIPITVTGVGTISGTIIPGNIPFSGTAPLINASVTGPSATTNYTISTLSIGGCPGTFSGTYTITIPVGTPGTWAPTQCIAGLADWYDCRNWAGGIIPTASIDVVIPASAACDPVIDNNSPLRNGPAVTNSITIEGRTLRMTNGGVLNVNGNWTNNVGTAGFDAGNGTVAFVGSGAQTINTSGAAENFHNLVVNKSSAGNAALGLTLNDAVNVGGTLTLTSGVVNNRGTANLLNVTNCDVGAVVGGSNTSYINGQIRRCTNSTSNYTFPVGDPDRIAGAYRPAFVQPAGSDPNVYTGEYYYGAVPENSFDVLDLVTGVINNEQWYVKGEGTCNSPASVGFEYINPASNTNWSPAGPLLCADCNVAVVYKPSDWYFTGPTGEFDGTRPETRSWTSNGVVWSKFLDVCTVNPYYSFGFGDYRVLPIRLLTFTGTLQNKNAVLQWRVADNKEVGSFEVELSTDGQNFRKVGTVNPGITSDYRFQHNGVTSGNNYYRLLMKSKDGTKEYSKVVMLSYNRIITTIIDLKPTLVKDLTQITVLSASNQGIHIQFFDTRGRLVRTEKAQLKMGMNTIPVYARGLASEMYIIHISTDDGAKGNYKIMKE